MIGPAFAGEASHAQLLLLGFTGASIGAYLLTALPGWTGWRAPPLLTALLVILWGLARIYPMANALYFAALAIVLAVLILHSDMFSRLWAPAFATLLALVSTISPPSPQTLTLALGALIATVGGRALPAFLASAKGHSPKYPPLLLRGAVPALLITAIVLDQLLLPSLAALFLLWQITQWHAPNTTLAFLLLPPWIWLAVGLLLNDTNILSSPTTLHALTMGAVGGMIHAFLSRILARRTGLLLIASPASLGAALALHIATIARLFDQMPVANTLWTITWGITLIQFLIHCRTPHIPPVFSGPRRV